MKQITLILIAFIAINVTKAQYVTIPDTHFVIWLNSNLPAAMNGNLMDTTSTYVTTLTTINVENLSITNLTGIQYFSSLITLDCGNDDIAPNPNNIQFLPPLPTTLDTLICGRNLLTSLPMLPSNLKVLKCYRNLLTNLPPLPNTLTYLDCSYNQIVSLPFFPSLLEVLIFNNNQITNLAILPPSLKVLDCSSNLISSLPFLSNSIIDFRCEDNQIDSIPLLPDSLFFFSCSGNPFTFLPPLPNTLWCLICANNLLTSLPPLPNSLTRLICINGHLESLPPLPNSLILLWCNDNSIKCFPTFPNSLVNSTLFIINGNPFTCLPNYVPAMDVSILSYPLCMVGDTVNNIYNCADAGSGILGYIFTDNNSNCNKDSVDLNLVNVHEMLYDINSNLLGQSYSALNGIYDFPVSTGIYIIHVDTSNVPFVVQCANPGVDSTIILTTTNPMLNNVNFSLICKPGFDVGVQSVLTDGFIFPGQQHKLKIVAGDLSHWYHLNCADGISGQIQVTVIGPVTYLGTAVGSLTPVVSGNTFIYTILDFGVINNEQDFGLIFTTDTTAQTGDEICVIITVNPITGDNVVVNNVFKNCYYVVNSHDPNMKEVYPVNVEPGYNDYFTYTIHFQNTGTAPAYNIRLVDTLNTNLDLETFQVTNYSNYNIVALKNNILTVRFPNIQLPDSTSNFDNSKGFFQYRIKPKANLILGTQIKNTAYIYFDYNTPVVTNTTINEYVQSVSVYKNNIKTSVKIYPNPTSKNITIEFVGNTTQDYFISIKNIQCREVLSEKINFQIKQTINVSNLCNGIYILSLQNETENNRFKIIIQK